MLALCTYSLDKFDARAILDVANNHKFTLIKRGDKWTLIESTQQKTKDALNKVKEREKFFANAIKFSAQPFSVESPDRCLVLNNHAFEDLTGYSGGELKKIKLPSALTPEEFLEIKKEKREELQRNGRPVKYETEFIRKDGARIPVELLVHLITNVEGLPEY